MTQRIINISIHAPHEGERPKRPRGAWNCVRFQSTLPTRGSDKSCRAYGGQASDFNPRSPRGGATIVSQYMLKIDQYFNPRSPRGGATACFISFARSSAHFNPRSPRGGATCNLVFLLCPPHISIHAPHEGERQKQRLEAELQELFQSTLPTRGSDRCRNVHPANPNNFNPRSPRGGATHIMCFARKSGK